jgi:predicted nucleic acid-binding protein
MIVVDANVIVYRYIQGPFTPLAEALLRRDSDWRTASLWQFEFASALATMMRANVLNKKQGMNALTAAMAEMPPRQAEVAQEQAIHIALRDRISVYDAQYIALAEILNLRCITADQPLARKTPSRSILLSDFVK